jgi:hypothetical protein
MGTFRAFLAMAVTLIIIVTHTQLASASAVLTYTGNNFTTFVDVDAVPGQYDTTMKVVASIELVSPLGANFDGDVTPLHATFNDGRQTITDPLDMICRPFPGPPCGFYHFTTDSSGSIEFWSISALTHPDGDVVASAIRSFNDGIKPIDSAFVSIPFARNLGADVAQSASPGTWVVVPEPSSLTLLTIGLAGIGVRRHFRLFFGSRPRR